MNYFKLLAYMIELHLNWIRLCEESLGKWKVISCPMSYLRHDKKFPTKIIMAQRGIDAAGSVYV